MGIKNTSNIKLINKNIKLYQNEKENMASKKIISGMIYEWNDLPEDTISINYTDDFKNIFPDFYSDLEEAFLSVAEKEKVSEWLENIDSPKTKIMDEIRQKYNNRNFSYHFFNLDREFSDIFDNIGNNLFTPMKKKKQKRTFLGVINIDKKAWQVFYIKEGEDNFPIYDFIAEDGRHLQFCMSDDDYDIFDFGKPFGMNWVTGKLYDEEYVLEQVKKKLPEEEYIKKMFLCLKKLIS